MAKKKVNAKIAAEPAPISIPDEKLLFARLRSMTGVLSGDGVDSHRHEEQGEVGE